MRSFAYWLIFVIVCWRSIAIAYFLGSGGFDARFFTYINYTLVWLLMILLAISMTDYRLYNLFVAFVVPVIYGTTIFVAFAIVVIIQLNDSLFIKTTLYNGGTRSIGMVHTGDFLLHYMPLIEILLVLFSISNSLTVTFAEIYNSTEKWSRVAYIAYFLLCPVYILFFYMSNINFMTNYPTMINPYLIWLITFVMSTLLQALLLALLIFKSKLTVQNPFIQGSGYYFANKKIKV